MRADPDASRDFRLAANTTGEQAVAPLATNSEDKATETRAGWQGTIHRFAPISIDKKTKINRGGTKEDLGSSPGNVEAVAVVIVLNSQHHRWIPVGPRTVVAELAALSTYIAAQELVVADNWKRTAAAGYQIFQATSTPVISIRSHDCLSVIFSAFACKSRHGGYVFSPLASLAQW